MQNIILVGLVIKKVETVEMKYRPNLVNLCNLSICHVGPRVGLNRVYK